MLKSVLYSCTLAAVVTLACGQQQLIQELDPFSSIASCTNVPVGIQPSKDNSYSVELQGDETQFPSIQAAVLDGTLYIQNSQNVTSDTGVIVLVSAPPDAITSLEGQGGGYVSMVGGFSADSFEATVVGSGDVDVSVDVSGKLNVTSRLNSRFQSFQVTGSSGSLSLKSEGDVDTFVGVYGLLGNATVDIVNYGEVFIGGSPNSVISGTKTTSASCRYTGASSTVAYEEYTTEGCTKQGIETPAISLPSLSSYSNMSVEPGTCISANTIFGTGGASAHGFRMSTILILLASMLM